MKKLLTFVTAAAAGVAAGMLLAPKSGKETRDELKAKADETKARANDTATRLKGAVKDGYESVRHTAGEVKDEAGALADHAKTSARGLAADAKIRGSRVGDKAEATSEELKAHAQKAKK